MKTSDIYPPNYFQKQDPSNDDFFYTFPRKVVHLDELAISNLSQFLGDMLPQDGVYLDLMSSWRSHLPATLTPKRVVGVGMNAEEMADNPQLDKYLVQNLNQTPKLPFEDGVFDGAICTVSVQYLTQPLEVFAEVARVLRPQAPFIVSFSNRCFPTKAVAVWRGTTDEQHVQLVGSYFAESGVWGVAQLAQFTPPLNDPLYIVWAHAQ